MHMSEPITISRQQPSVKALDYAFLRKEGLSYIEKFAGKIWTDYNVHDPGVTMLEALCYAITDLGYKTTAPIEDILASKEQNNENYESQFYSAAEILTVKPVTVNDYRRLLIDLPELSNAWLFKATETVFYDKTLQRLSYKAPQGHNQWYPVNLNGIYDIRIDINRDFFRKEGDEGAIEDISLTKEQKEGVIKKVYEVFHRNRNLCEDVHAISLVEEQPVIICSDIEIDNDADIEQVYAEILFAVQNYLTPQVKHNTLGEMLSLTREDGSHYTVDEIYNGPRLDNGFISDEELNKAELRTTLYASDIISQIMDIKGVAAIKKLMLNFADKLQQSKEWCLSIKSGNICKPVLDISKTAIHFFRDVIPVQVRMDVAKEKYNQLMRAEYARTAAGYYQDYDYPKGSFADSTGFTSVSGHLPQVYGISKAGLPKDASEERRALSRQLKGYLLFFDQVMANYLAQLDKARDFFRIKEDAANPLNNLQPSEYYTYYFQPVNGMMDIEHLLTTSKLEPKKIEAGDPVYLKKLKDDFDAFYKSYEQGQEDKLNGGDHGRLAKIMIKHDNPVERKNRFLDHLMARFCESFNDYVLQLYSVFGQRTDADVLWDKAVFLREYAQISSARGAGFDYYNKLNAFNMAIPVWGTANISGLEHRLCRLLGMSSIERRNLSFIQKEDYQEIDKDDKNEYRFRITDPLTDKILLSSGTKYLKKNECTAHMQRALKLAAFRINYEEGVTVNGKFYFNIVDASLNDPNAPVAARRIEYFDTAEEREAAIDYLIKFVQSKVNDEGLFVIEHALLREDLAFLAAQEKLPPEEQVKPVFLPVCDDEDCEGGCGSDPYSFRITVVLPSEALRFKEEEFKLYVEKVVRLETPAHIMPKVCWLSKDTLGNFEKAYKTWLGYKQNGEINTSKGKDALAKLAEILFTMRNDYPPGRLAETPTDEQPGFMLGRASLAELERKKK
jgi:uncharacterized protein